MLEYISVVRGSDQKHGLNFWLFIKPTIKANKHEKLVSCFSFVFNLY